MWHHLWYHSLHFSLSLLHVIVRVREFRIEEGAAILEGGGGGSGRTRSISLSSGDTDNEQEGGHSSRARQAGIATSSTALSSSELKVLAGRHSTHSLNDMGFPVSRVPPDFLSVDSLMDSLRFSVYFFSFCLTD